MSYGPFKRQEIAMHRYTFEKYVLGITLLLSALTAVVASI